MLDGGSAVGHRFERVADLAPASESERTESRGEHGLGYRGEVVEGGNAFVVDPVIGPTGMQVEMFWIVLVTGATTTLLRTGITSSRETTSTGRRFSFGVSISQSSSWATTARPR